MLALNLQSLMWKAESNILQSSLQEQSSGQNAYSRNQKGSNQVCPLDTTHSTKDQASPKFYYVFVQKPCTADGWMDGHRKHYMPPIFNKVKYKRSGRRVSKLTSKCTRHSSDSIMKIVEGKSLKLYNFNCAFQNTTGYSEPLTVLQIK